MTREFKIEIDTVCFNAVRKFVAPFATDPKKESYCYLHLELGSKKGLLVGHDGVALLCYTFDVNLPDVTEPIVVNIKRDFVQEDATAPLTVITHKDVANFNKYEPWRRAFPTAMSNEASHFNSKYLMKIEAAGALLLPGRVSGVTYSHNGQQPALFKFDDREDLIGVLNPLCNQPDPLTATPPWVKAPLEVAEDFSDLI